MINVKFPSFKKLVNKRFVEIFNNKDRYLFLWGGRNSGKSVSASRKLIYRCLNEKYFRYILIKKTFESIKDSQWRTLKDDVEQLGLSELFEFRKAPLEIECVNGNMFIARGLDKVEKLKSIKDPTGAWYEEGNQITLEDFITVTTSIRSIRADYIQEIFSFNPETEIDYEEFWLWQMFFKSHAEKNFKDDIEIKLQNGDIIKNAYTSHHTTYHDNKYLTDIQRADLEQWKKINPYYYTIYTLGEWGNKVVKDKFWKSFDRVKHVKAVKLDLELPLHISFDENVNPYPALSIWQIKDKKVKQVHEICLRNPNNKVKSVGKEFVGWARRNDWSNVVYIYGDATSAKEDTKLEAGVNYFTMLRDIIEQDFPVQIRKPSKNPPVALSAEFVNAIYEMNYQDIEIIIGDNCKESINDYSLVQEKTDGTMKKPKDKNGIEILGHCFVGDTLIRTDKGSVKITDIRKGDYVQTRKGYKKVIASKLTRKNALVKTYNICGNEITCTPDHKIFTLNRGFIEASKLIISDTFCIFDQWKKKRYITTAKSLSGRLRANALIRFIMLAELMEEIKRFIYIDIFGSRKGAKYPKDITYITKTKIPIIIQLIIWNVLRLKNIGKDIKVTIGIIPQKVKNIFLKYRNLLRSGIDRQRVENGIVNTLKKLWLIEQSKNMFVMFVETNILLLRKRIIDFVPVTAQVSIEGEAVLIMNQENVLFVKTPSLSINTQKSNAVQEFVAKNSERYADVYDLTVEDQPEFYANNILVHNCSDTKRYFLVEAFSNEFRQYQRRSGKTDYTLAPVKQNTY